jgi:hypothetical protein
MRSRFRRAWRIAGVVGVASLTVPMSPAAAESLRYQAGAAADGARLSVTIPGATVVDQIIDGGGPTAQAAVSSLGGSSALAAQPYPGELAIIGPGLGASLIGAPQPPAYPFVAASRHPSAPEQAVEPNPGYSLVARSTESTSEASARSGAANETSNVFLTQATATVKADPEQVVAEAANHVEALTVGPLSIASAASSARVVGKPNGDPERASSLVVNGVTIAGQSVGFTDAGFVTPGGATPLPSSDPLLKALSSAGVAVSYLKPETTPTGVVAPGLQIVTTQSVPGAGRTATISLTLGRAQANAQASTEAVELPTDVPVAASPESADPAGSLSGSEAPTPVAIAPPTASTPAFDLTPVFQSPASSLGMSLSSDGVVGSPAGTETAPAGGGPATMTAAAPVALAARPTSLNRISAGSTFYPLLLAAGALALVGFQIVRTVGVTK